MRKGECLFLTRNFLKSQGFLFYAEVIAVFIVFFITTLVLSLMNGLQDKQFETLKNVASFPLIIKNAQKDDYDNLLNLTECQSGKVRIYPYKDYKMLSKSSGSIAKLRVADISYYNDKIFKNYFYIFPYDALKKGLFLYQYGEAINGDVYYYVDKGESGSDIIKELDAKNTSSYAMNTSLYETIFYKTEPSFFEKYKHFDIGVLSDDEGIIAFEKKLKPDFSLSSYKEDVRDVYSALTIENAMLFLVMLFLLLIVFLTFQKSIKNLIFRKKSEVVVLRALGKSRREVFSLFLFAYTVPLLLSEILSVFLASIFIKTGIVGSLSSKFKGMPIGFNNLTFILDAKELTYMVFISFLIYLTLLAISINSVSKISINEVREE